MLKPTTVILAGGLGTRIKHLLEGLPKPLAPVAGRPFLDWLVRYYVKQGLEDFIISAGYRADAITEFCASANIPGARLRCVAEGEPQGTAGGFCCAVADDASANWLVCNGDSLVMADLAPFLSQPWRPNEAARVLALEVAEGSRFGTLAVGPDAMLQSFREKVAGSGLINAGVYLFAREMLAAFPDRRPLSFEHDVFPQLLEQKQGIGVDKVAAPFIDIGTEASLAEAEAFILKNREHFA